MEDGYSNNDSQVLQMRVTDAERRAAAAESALSSMERANPVSAASAEEVKVLREENQRLLHLLSKANDDLNSARKIIDEQGYADGATALLVNERVQAAEEARRRVEQDFQRLVEQMQQMESGAGGELLDRLRELEEVNTELEYENDALRESLAGTEEAIAVMQQDCTPQWWSSMPRPRGFGASATLAGACIDDAPHNVEQLHSAGTR